MQKGSCQQGGEFLRVAVSSNWFSGRVRPPYPAVKLLRLMKRMELPGWDGWSFHSGRLWTPEGHSIQAADGAWWSLLVRQARCFRAAYAEACQLRADLAMIQAVQPIAQAGAASLADGGAAGLVPSKTSRQSSSRQIVSSSPEPFVRYELDSSTVEVTA